MKWYNIDLHWAYGDLLSSIYRRTLCLDTAYDILHDALIRYAANDRRDDVRQPHAYLQTVVRSVLARHGMDSARWLPLPENGEILPRDIVFEPTPEHLASLREQLCALQKLLDCLPPRCREVFRLYRVDGLTQPEIAAKLGISRRTVESHLERALADLALAAQDLA